MPARLYGFGPTALEDVCNILNLTHQAERERELVAQKIVGLARQGKRDAALLRDRMLREVAHGQGSWPATLVRAARHGAL